MKKIILLIFVLSVLFQSCKNNSADQNELAKHNSEAVNYNNKGVSEQPRYYCKVTIGEEEFVTSDCLMISSNAVRKERILTIFDISVNPMIEDKYHLSIALNKRHNSLDPKLELGNYNIFVPWSDDEDYENGFLIIGNVVSEKSFQAAKEGDLLHEIEEGSYVLVSDYQNVLKINEVNDLGVKEKGPNYTVGKYRVKGEAQLKLFRIDTKEELMVTMDFDVEQEWYISK